MNRPDQHDGDHDVLGSVASRLDRMSMIEPPPYLRRRVLSAVAAVLAEPPARETIQAGQWSLLTAAAAAVILVAPWSGSLRIGSSPADSIPSGSISPAARSAAAGLALEPLGDVGSIASSTISRPPPASALTPLDARRWTEPGAPLF